VLWFVLAEWGAIALLGCSEPLPLLRWVCGAEGRAGVLHFSRLVVGRMYAYPGFMAPLCGTLGRYDESQVSAVCMR
jgi:hypothetical protein